MTSPNVLSNPIKLVIWDLDETFWKGTLSEEGIELIKPHCDLVVELSKRGIVNSICSKNDADLVCEVLTAQGLADYFVFSHIAWTPKGPAIKDMLLSMGLGPQNVLFVDDNHLNREEVKHYSPDIQVAHPEILEYLADMEACRGKPDPELSRLRQYQLLEIKQKEQKNSVLSNTEFLRQSEIKVYIGEDVHNHVERLQELISRTNQLNFTKQRLNLEEVQRLIADPTVECRYLSVQDKYGEYGIAGFYALRKNRLEHFLFSCRILNMGVEQWLFERLGRPDLELIDPVSSSLDDSAAVHWISHSPSPFHESSKAKRQEALSILIKGNCALDQLEPFITTGGGVMTEFNYVGNCPLPVHNEHTEMLLRTVGDRVQGFEEVISQIPFLDENSYKSNVFSSQYDVLIYCLDRDFTCGLYRYQNSDFVVPYGDFLLDITNKDVWPKLGSRLAHQKRFLYWFRDNFTALGPISPEQFTKNIHWLSQNLQNKHIIFINAAEIDVNHNIEINRWKHHRKMNEVLEEAVGSCSNAQVCDLRTIIQSEDDVTTDLRHFHRQGYYQIALELKDIIAKTTTQMIRVSRLNYYRNLTTTSLNRFPEKVGRVLRRLIHS